MPKALSVDWDRALVLKAAGKTYREIGQELACNPGTIKARFSRKGINRTALQARAEVVQSVAECVSRSLVSLSKEVRTDFAASLAAHAKALQSLPVKPDLRHLAQIGAALEPLVRSSKVVFDWGQQRLGTPVIIMDECRETDDAIPVVPVNTAISETRELPVADSVSDARTDR